MPGEPARRHATYEDVLNAPEHLVAEILDGDLYLSPRPAGAHAEASSVLTMDLGLEPFNAVELELEALWPTPEPGGESK